MNALAPILLATLLAAPGAPVAPDVALRKMEKAVREAAREGAPPGALRTAVNDSFDVEELARRSLGEHWKAAPRTDQERFVSLLWKLVEGSYLPRIRGSPDYQLELGAVAREGDTARVAAKGSAKGGEVALEFRLQLKKGRWRVYDTLIDGVSLVETYAEQFERILRKGGWPQLLSTLETKVKASEGASP